MEDDSLRRMEALGVDLAGHIFKTERNANKSRDHMESHLLMLGPRALDHKAFRKFWSDYVMSSERKWTILHGEIGLAQSFSAAGLTIQGLLDRQRIVDLLAGLPADVLHATLDHLVFHDDIGRSKRATLQGAAVAGQAWREDFLA